MTAPAIIAGFIIVAAFVYLHLQDHAETVVSRHTPYDGWAETVETKPHVFFPAAPPPYDQDLDEWGPYETRSPHGVTFYRRLCHDANLTHDELMWFFADILRLPERKEVA